MSGGELAAALGVAFLWDLAAGEPPAALSPRAWMAGLARFLARRLPRGTPGRERVRGVLLVLLVPLAFAGASWALLSWLVPERPVAAFLVTVVLLRGTLSLLQVGRGSLDILRALQGGTPHEARGLLSGWLGRPTPASERDELVVATVEQVARRTSQAAIGPVLWYALAGVPGAMLHRGVDVLGELLLDRDPPARREPTPAPAEPDAAELDSNAAPDEGAATDAPASPPTDPPPLGVRPLHGLLAFLPARLATMLLLTAGMLLGEDGGRGMALAGRAAGRPGTRSPELPAAALVGLLGLSPPASGDAGALELHLPPPSQPLAAMRIHQAWRVALLATGLLAALVALLLWSVGGPLLDPVR